MCGRYTLAADGATLQRHFDLESLPDLPARYNIAPTQPVPIITSHAPRQLTYVRWGLVPSWAKDLSVGNKMINARSETADEKPSFRAAFKYRRCLVPATGFYEWKKTDAGKQPHYIQFKDGRLFAFAGLWENWQSPDGSEVQTCTILTSEPNALISDLHHRMAVILAPQDYKRWLAKDTDSAALKNLLLTPHDDTDMETYPISSQVNSPKNDGPQLIEPYEPPKQKTLF